MEKFIDRKKRAESVGSPMKHTYSIYITNTQNRRGGSKTVPQKRLSPTAPASAGARGRRHNYTRPVSRNPRATSTPRSTSMPLNAFSGFRGGRADESTAGVVDCKEASNLRERVGKACIRPLCNQQKRHTADENPLLSMGVAHHVVTGAAYPEFRPLAIGIRFVACKRNTH